MVSFMMLETVEGLLINLFASPRLALQSSLFTQLS